MGFKHVSDSITSSITHCFIGAGLFLSQCRPHVQRLQSNWSALLYTATAMISFFSLTLE